MEDISTIHKPTKPHSRKQLMLQCLEKHLGIVTLAAKDAGIDRWTHYEWLKTDPEYKAAVESMKELVIDFAEGALFKNIQDQKEVSILFYLKCQAKHRGYIEKAQVELSGEITENKVVKGISIAQAAEILSDDDD